MSEAVITRDGSVMAFGTLSIFDALARRMNWLSERQGVLAENIANADTPGYEPRDLRPDAFQRALRRALRPVPQRVTDPGHIDARVPAKPDFRIEDSEEKYETSPTGNAVVLEEQMVKVSETQLDYQTITNLYRKHLAMFRTALGRGGGAG